MLKIVEKAKVSSRSLDLWRAADFCLGPVALQAAQVAGPSRSLFGTTALAQRQPGTKKELDAIQASAAGELLQKELKRHSLRLGFVLACLFLHEGAAAAGCGCIVT